ncbi:transporter [Mariniflexile sp.]|uniref:transporter n=1 Tax=Mariniflexile sp. TaxID=1979402 RepID=UPI0040481673
MKKVYYSVLVLCLTACSVFAQTIITDRPDQTESSSTIEKGSLQIETGILLSFSEDDFSSERQLLAPTTLFRYGITNGIEIRVLSQFESLKDQNSSQEVSGISDLEIGTKIQLFKKENVNAEIAFISHLVLPTGSKSLTNDTSGTINKLSISHGLSDTMSIGYNVGYDYFGEGNGHLTYSAALGISITDTFGLYMEPYGNIIEFENHEASFDAGITYLCESRVKILQLFS